MAWYDDMENVYKWHDTARQAAVLQRVLREDDRSDSPYDDKSYMVLYSTFAEEIGPMTAFETGRAMFMEFSNWLTGSGIEPFRHNKRFYAEVSKSYGGITVTFGFGATFDVLPHQSSGAYNHCVAMVHEQFKRYEMNGLPQQSAPTRKETNTNLGETVTFISDALEVEIKDGKPYYKIKGAQYSKFGVRVWSEVLEAAGIDVGEFEVGSNHFVRECSALLQDGKVRKVVHIK